MFFDSGEPSGAMFMPTPQNVAQKLGKSNGTWHFRPNTKTTWTKLYEGSRAIGDNSTPWHPTLTFASFDIIVIDFVMHNHHKMIPFYVGHVDNQTFMDSWGYQAPDDPMHRIVTLTVGISGRYFNNIGAKMLYGNSYTWEDCLQAVYVDKIWGLNCINQAL